MAKVKAIRFSDPGGPDVLHLEQIDLCAPELFDFDFLVDDDRAPPQPVPAARVVIDVAHRW